MTISTQTNSFSALGNGSATVFPYTFRVLDAADLRVYVAGTLQSYGSQYSLTGVGTDSGTVVFVTAPANAASVVGQRVTPSTQGVDLTNYGPWSSSQIEGALDKAAMADQDSLNRDISGDRTAGRYVVCAADGKLTTATGGVATTVGSGTQLDAGTLGGVAMSAGGVATANLAANAVTTVKIATGAVTVEKLAASLLQYIFPAGSVVEYYSNTLPDGFLWATGGAVSRTTYATLFARIGTTFGAGDGSTTFNLPNRTRRVAVGSGGTGTATLGNTLGATGGSETHPLTVAEIPSHHHSYVTPYASGDAGLTSTAGGGGLATTSDTGGGAAHNNMQPSIVCNFIIKY